MSQSLAKNLVHLIYSTKNRQTWLREELRADLFAYQAGIFKQWDSPAIAIGGVEDHVHSLFMLSKNHSLAKVIEEVKKGSSKWIKGVPTGVPEFYWQGGYAAFSVSQSNAESVREYIEQQATHHQKFDFKHELRLLCERHKVKFDERYAWD